MPLVVFRGRTSAHDGGRVAKHSLFDRVVRYCSQSHMRAAMPARDIFRCVKVRVKINTPACIWCYGEWVLSYASGSKSCERG